MKLVSMKLSKAERETDAGPVEQSDDPYPYGLCLRLDEGQLEKLGYDPEVGGDVVIEAKGVVTMYRESTNGGAKPDCDAEIQITDLSISESAASLRKKAAGNHLDEISKPTSRY